MNTESAGGGGAGNDQLPEQLNLILQEWSQLIVSLAALIRENVESLLPAVFNLSALASKASEARVEASGTAREAGASLRDRAEQLNDAMRPLVAATGGTDALRAQLGELSEQAAALRTRGAGIEGFDRFIGNLLDGPQAALPRMQQLLDASLAVQKTGGEALQQLTSGLDMIDKLLHADTAEIEAAAGRVRHFVESSRSAVEQLIVKLQFQDRTDQILSHLLADFDSLSSALNEVGSQAFDVDAWRNARAKRFTTEEERRAGSSGPLSTEPGDIELF